MFRFRKKTPTYKVEPTGVQLRIMRTHIAAMAGELSSMRVLLQAAVDKMTQEQQR